MTPLTVNTLLSILVLRKMCENEVAEEMPSYISVRSADFKADVSQPIK